MKIAVVGVGAMGSVYAGLLASGGHEVWAVDVKDWVSPYLLAKHVRPIPQAPAWDRAWFVFPQQRGRRQEYVRTFTYHASVLGGNPPTHAALERTFLQHVRRTLEGAT